MIEIAYSEKEIYVDGNLAGLQKIVSALNSLKKFIEIDTDIPVKVCPLLGVEFIKRLVIEKSNEQLIISRQEQILKIEGKQDLLNILAENIAFLWNERQLNSGNHIHEEYYEGHFYYHPKSLPTVFTLTKYG